MLAVLFLLALGIIFLGVIWMSLKVFLVGIAAAWAVIVVIDRIRADQWRRSHGISK
jgi:hypothetical protein